VLGVFGFFFLFDVIISPRVVVIGN
jgi:hypothetical protein